MRDFFLSYHPADQGWAEWLAWHLEQAGFTVVIRAWDFQAGGNSVLQLHEAIAGCERTLLVLTPRYVAEEVVALEWSAALGQDEAAARRKVVPIRVKPCKPRGLLKLLDPIELCELDEEEARKKLLSRLGRGRAKPQQPPSFPGAPKFPGASRQPAPRENGARPAPRHVLRACGLLLLAGLAGSGPYYFLNRQPAQALQPATVEKPATSVRCGDSRCPAAMAYFPASPQSALPSVPSYPDFRLPGALPDESYCLDCTEITVADFTNYMNQISVKPILMADGSMRVVDNHGNGILNQFADRRMIHFDGKEWGALPDDQSRPIVGVLWHSAQDYCRTHNKALPTVAQWVYAALGAGLGRRFPWGDRAPECGDIVSERVTGRCRHLPPGPQQVATARLDQTPEGVADLYGNASEFVVNPLKRMIPHILGSDYNLDFNKWLQMGTFEKITYTEPGLGFRCAITIKHDFR